MNICLASVVAMAMLAASSGCSTLRSHGPASPMLTRSSHAAEGFSYYLPKRFARIVFERFEVDKEADKKLKERVAELAKAKELLVAAKQGVADSVSLRDKLLAATTPPQPQLNQAIAAVAAAEISQGAAERAVNKSTEAVANAQAAVEAAKLGDKLCGHADRFTISLLPAVADPALRYVVESVHLWTRSDEVALKTTKSGLLSNVTSKATDQTGEILISLAQGRAAIRASSGTPSVPGSARAAVSVAAPPLDPCFDQGKPRVTPLKIEDVLDPTDSAALDAFARHVTAKASVGAIPARPATAPHPAQPALPALFDDTYELIHRSFSSAQPSRIGNNARQPDVADGLVYRRELPVLLNVFSYPAPAPARSTTAPLHCAPATGPRPANCALMGSWMLEIPNQSPLEVVPAKASLFVASSMKFEFDNGMLLASDSSRPSELGRVAALPVEYAMSILEIPAKIFSLKIDLRGKETELTSGDTDLINAEIARIQAQLELENARKAAEKESEIDADDVP